jgi:hypothetical protein
MGPTLSFTNSMVDLKFGRIKMYKRCIVDVSVSFLLDLWQYICTCVHKLKEFS